MNKLQRAYAQKLENKREWYQNNKEHVMAYCKEYRRLHKKRLALYNKRYFKRYYIRNREKILKNQKEYCKKPAIIIMISKRKKEYYLNNLNLTKFSNLITYSKS